jgi:hypothetical protein
MTAVNQAFIDLSGDTDSTVIMTPEVDTDYHFSAIIENTTNGPRSTVSAIVSWNDGTDDESAMVSGAGVSGKLLIPIHVKGGTDVKFTATDWGADVEQHYDIRVLAFSA